MPYDYRHLIDELELTDIDLMAAYIPTPDEIKTATEKFQKGWSKAEENSRSVTKRVPLEIGMSSVGVKHRNGIALI